MKQLVFLLLIFQLNLCLADEQCTAPSINEQLEQAFERDQGLRMAYMLTEYDQKFSPSTEHQKNKEKAWGNLRAGD